MELIAHIIANESKSGSEVEVVDECMICCNTYEGYYDTRIDCLTCKYNICLCCRMKVKTDKCPGCRSNLSTWIPIKLMRKEVQRINNEHAFNHRILEKINEKHIDAIKEIEDLKRENKQLAEFTRKLERKADIFERQIDLLEERKNSYAEMAEEFKTEWHLSVQQQSLNQDPLTHQLDDIFIIALQDFDRALSEAVAEEPEESIVHEVKEKYNAFLKTLKHANLRENVIIKGKNFEKYLLKTLGDEDAYDLVDIFGSALHDFKSDSAFRHYDHSTKDYSYWIENSDDDISFHKTADEVNLKLEEKYRTCKKRKFKTINLLP